MAGITDFALGVAQVDATAGTSHRISAWLEKSIVAFVVGAGDYLIQVSNNETTWVDVGAAITVGSEVRSTEDAVAIPKSVKFIRIFTTTHAATSVFVFHGTQPPN